MFIVIKEGFFVCIIPNYDVLFDEPNPVLSELNRSSWKKPDEWIAHAFAQLIDIIPFVPRTRCHKSGRSSGFD